MKEGREDGRMEKWKNGKEKHACWQQEEEEK